MASAYGNPVKAFIAGVLLCGALAAAAAPAEKPHRTAISGKPWVPAPAPASPKVVYGTDDRIDLYEETDPDRRTWAASTCGLFTSSSVTSNGNGTYTIHTSAYDVCSDEPFSNQPTSAFCTGFVVGDDIIATAGHCFDSGDLNNTKFVFGFVMEDANTPVLAVSADQVYTGVELLGRALQGDLDYAVIRVDRNIVAPGVQPFTLRREGTIGIGSNVGVIGHPSGLPLKLAFGDNTVVRDNTNTGYFVANLDTYGGNSGSPVINPATGILEGILVRGEQDFVLDGNCLRSNVVPNTGGGGEEVSKATTFMQFVPELISSNAMVSLDRGAFRCTDTATVTVSDADLMGAGTTTVSVATSGGDMETVTLTEDGSSGQFEGTFPVSGGAVTTANGTVETAEGETLNVTYTDLIHDVGSPDMVVVTAGVDCTAPEVSGVTVTLIGARFATVQFTTNEAASGRIVTGETCGASDSLADFASAISHSVLVQSLLPLTPYFYSIEVADEAGNMAVADNGGACFMFTTTETTQYYSEVFNSIPPDVQGRSVEFAPAEGGGYTICQNSITELPVSTLGATRLSLGDDTSQLVLLGSMATFPFYGVEYDRFYVNANGNITFGSPDGSYDIFTSIHFSLPRVAPCFTDLNPSVGGLVSYRQLGDRVVVTWLNVPHFDFGGANTTQVELYFDGTIRMSYLSLNARPSIVGLSAGTGVASDFVSTDLSAQAMCDLSATTYHSADTNQDLLISLQELLRVVQFLNLSGYHCDAAGEDGYAPGPGDQNCMLHDSDYNPQDWDISLSELLRLVQFFNAISYEYDSGAGTEDGFVPITSP